MTDASTSPEHPDFPRTKGYAVFSPVGPVWFVPFEAAVQDYAAFLVEQDGLMPEAARAQVLSYGEDAIDTWYFEQFTWTEIQRLGQLVVPKKRGDMPASKRKAMLKISPLDDVRRVGFHAACSFCGSTHSLELNETEGCRALEDAAGFECLDCGTRSPSSAARG